MYSLREISTDPICTFLACDKILLQFPYMPVGYPAQSRGVCVWPLLPSISSEQIQLHDVMENISRGHRISLGLCPRTLPVAWEARTDHPPVPAGSLCGTKISKTDSPPVVSSLDSIENFFGELSAVGHGISRTPGDGHSRDSRRFSGLHSKFSSFQLMPWVGHYGDFLGML